MKELIMKTKIIRSALRPSMVKLFIVLVSVVASAPKNLLGADNVHQRQAIVYLAIGTS
jgi:hypothetical protein